MFRDPTPTRSTAKHGMFERQAAKLQYYEDGRGTRNVAEDHEGAGEMCESDSDGDDGFLAAVKKLPEHQSQYGSYHSEAQGEVMGNALQSKIRNMSSAESDDDDGDEEGKEVGVNAAISDSEDHIHRADSGFQIVPKLDSKRSLPRAQVKKARARKPGLLLYTRDTSTISKADRNDAKASVMDSDGGAADDEASEMTLRPLSVQTPHRQSDPPVSSRAARRVPFKQQLAARFAAKATAENAEKKARRLEEVAEKAVAVARAARLAVMAGAMDRGGGPRVFAGGSQRARTTSKQTLAGTHHHQARAFPTAMVVVDNGDVDLSEYVRYP